MSAGAFRHLLSLAQRFVGHSYGLEPCFEIVGPLSKSVAAQLKHGHEGVPLDLIGGLHSRHVILGHGFGAGFYAAHIPCGDRAQNAG